MPRAVSTQASLILNSTKHHLISDNRYCDQLQRHIIQKKGGAGFCFQVAGLAKDG